MRTFLLAGLDGSGKTSHATRLMAELAARGVKTKYIYMRGYGRVFLAFPFLAFSRVIGLTRVHRLREGVRASEYRFYANGAFRSLWPWVSLFDSLLFSVASYQLSSPFSSKTVMFSDRSVVDTLSDVISDTKKASSLHFFSKFFIGLIPHNSLVIVFDLDEEIAFSRKKDVFSLDFLRTRRQTYLKLAKTYGWSVIRTESSFSEVHCELLKAFNSWFNAENEA